MHESHLLISLSQRVCYSIIYHYLLFFIRLHFYFHWNRFHFYIYIRKWYHHWLLNINFDCDYICFFSARYICYTHIWLIGRYHEQRNQWNHFNNQMCHVNRTNTCSLYTYIVVAFHEKCINWIFWWKQKKEFFLVVQILDFRYQTFNRFKQVSVCLNLGLIDWSHETAL